jgi:hypothetical protein
MLTFYLYTFWWVILGRFHTTQRRIGREMTDELEIILEGTGCELI